MRRPGARALLLAFALIALVSYGCAPPRAHTTFLRSVDLIEMTDRMARSLTADPVVAARSEGDDRWVVSFDRVANHTNQIIPEREKWIYIARLRALLAQTDFAKKRAIVWVMPPERWNEIAAELGEDAPAELRMRPTHVLTAEFGALTLTSGAGRSDAYLCSFQLVDLATGGIVWEDAWEVKRALAGRTYD